MSNSNPTKYCPDTRCINSHKGKTTRMNVLHRIRHFYICNQCELKANNEISMSIQSSHIQKLNDKVQSVVLLNNELNRLNVMKASCENMTQETSQKGLSLNRAGQMKHEFLQIIEDHINDVYDKLDAILN